MLTFGVITGLGLALGYVTAVVDIAYWFNKRLSMANGLGVCGTGIGTFLIAPLTQALIEYYGWRGTTMLLGELFFPLRPLRVQRALYFLYTISSQSKCITKKCFQYFLERFF